MCKCAYISFPYTANRANDKLLTTLLQIPTTNTRQVGPGIKVKYIENM